MEKIENIKKFKRAIYKWMESIYCMEKMNELVDFTDECAESFNYEEWLEDKCYEDVSFMKLHEQIEDAFFL